MIGRRTKRQPLRSTAVNFQVLHCMRSLYRFQPPSCGPIAISSPRTPQSFPSAVSPAGSLHRRPMHLDCRCSSMSRDWLCGQTRTTKKGITRPSIKMQRRTEWGHRCDLIVVRAIKPNNVCCESQRCVTDTAAVPNIKLQQWEAKGATFEYVGCRMR